MSDPLKPAYTSRWELKNGKLLSSGSTEFLLGLLNHHIGHPPPGEVPLKLEDIPVTDTSPIDHDMGSGIERIPLAYDTDEDGDVDLQDFGSAYNAQRKWCPWARDLPNHRKRSNYKTKNGLPKGAVVHFTAGHPDYSLERMGEIAIDSGMCYWCITEEGEVGQPNPLTDAGYHAGQSSYPGLNGYVSDELLGIELAAPGRLKEVGGGKAVSWFPRKFDVSKCRRVAAKDNVKAGLYYAYTEDQEAGLRRTLMWLKFNDPYNFSFDLVLGHDEVASARKDDPGGALSMTMPEFRQSLKDDWEVIVEVLGLPNDS